MKIVHVAAFEPKPEKNGHGVGGFYWFHTPAAADKEFADHSAGDPDSDHFRFDAIVTSEESATAEIDEHWTEWRQYHGRTEPMDLRAVTP